MKRFSLNIIIFLSIPFFIKAQTNYAQYVNPFIGTGGHGHTFPGAALPFGMVQLSPDTRIDGSWDGCGGYHYSDSIIYGFSHTHLSGTGVSDYGDILLMPMLGAPSIDNKIYSSKFNHLKEKANAGFYEVMLEDDKIKAELTTTLRTGIHKYTFPKTDKANIILDLLHRDKTLSCNLKILDSVTVSGFRTSEAWAKEQHVYFIMKFSKPFKKMEYSVKRKFQTSLNDKLNEQADGAYFEFDVSDGAPLVVKVGISSTNTDGAMRNLEAEAKHWDFEKYKKDAELTWNKELSKIEVESNDKDKLSVFYTALYHCMIHPSLNVDVDGQYRGRDNTIHTAKNFNYYTVFSLWDTFRALHPLFTIIDRKRTSDFINTFLAQYKESGRLPVWELSSNETDCMIGYHSVSVISDAFTKDIFGYDSLAIYKAMKAASNYTGYGAPVYAKQGYLQIDDEHESVSKTLEYAYDDWCIAQVAERLNIEKDNIQYIKRAQSYKNLFDPSTGFMRPRKNGNWLSPFDPSEVNNHFTEANSWQYSFFVPHDIYGLIKLHGGDLGFEKKLDELFSTESKTTGREQADITGLIGQYAHGNEPSHHMAYLYNYIGKPQKTIQKVHQILNQFYKNAPDGLIGNEDCGAMSAWYVLSSMGIYQVCPGKPEYILGLPLFEKIKIHLENGKIFEIETPKTSAGNETPEVTSVSLNTKSNVRSFVTYDQIYNGGKLVFNFTPKKGINNYGQNKLMRPLTGIAENLIIPVPIIKSESKSFKGKQSISLESVVSGTIMYTLDGSEPAKKSKIYSKPFIIENTCVVKARIYLDTTNSEVTTAHFYKAPNNYKITLNCKYDKQYTAGGDNGLIDGIYGETNWRKGEWQGYQSQDFNCVIDMGISKSIRSINSNYLQDSRSWILFPTEIEYLISDDGKNFKSVKKIVNPVAADNYEVMLKKFNYKSEKPIKTRYVKIMAKNFGKLPEGHLGIGGDAFIFIDEIEIK
ncbi:MAG TPA: GH92 family glycosyl hydrolase [Bacteroidia bacterium]|jgi:predicted alpha-1,2-mannosidase|nr:GH92 family glycosyl hydrolase [Bacteroidia bacterium]